MVRCTVHLALALLFLRACSIIVLLSLLCLWALVCIIHADDRQILFYDKLQPYYDFTNFAPYPIVVERVMYPTSEHYFQAQKLIGTQHFHQILTNPSPRYAFEYARQERVKPWIRKDWQEIKNDVMFKALYHKFTQHSALARMLLQTGDKELIEDSPYDSYWGCGRDKQGMNMLGKLLMRLRKILAAASMEVPVTQIIAFDSHSTESSSNVIQAASMGVPCVAQTHSTESSPNIIQKDNVQTETDHDDDNSSSQTIARPTDANATPESNVQSGDGNSSSQIITDTEESNKHVETGNGNSSPVASQITALHLTDTNAQEVNVQTGDGNPSTEASQARITDNNQNANSQTDILDLQLGHQATNGVDRMDQGHSGNENISQDTALCTSNASIPNQDGSEATNPSTNLEEMETNENETSSSDKETN